MTPEELAAIKERADKATAADALTLSKYAHGGGRLYVVGGPNAERQLVADFYDEDNRQFYYNARTDVPALVAEVERLRRVEAAARAYMPHLPEPGASHGAGRYAAQAIASDLLRAALRAAESGD